MSPHRIEPNHALRGASIRRILDAGATVKEAMELARHSDPKLTLKPYARIGIANLSGVLSGIPSMSPAALPRSGPRRRGLREGSSIRSRATRLAAIGGNDRHDQAVAGLIGGKKGSSANHAGSRAYGNARHRVAHGGKNAEGRTRTADLRVMNPAL